MKSPRAVTLEALEVARTRLPAYAHACSPKKFTQHQLFAILVLKGHQRQDYRGVVALLGDMPQLVEELGLICVPHYTTLQKAAVRLLAFAPAQRLLTGTVERFKKKAAVASSATSPRPIRREWTPAGRAGISSDAAKIAQKSKN